MNVAAEWFIIYLRPDGWWLAGGVPFDSETEATVAATEHEWRGTSWRVVESRDLDAMLCEEAQAARDDMTRSQP